MARKGTESLRYAGKKLKTARNLGKSMSCKAEDVAWRCIKLVLTQPVSNVSAPC